MGVVQSEHAPVYMPVSPRAGCRIPSCPARAEFGAYCRTHARSLTGQSQSPGGRTYSSTRWRTHRAAFLKAYPHCGDRPLLAPLTLDSHCQRDHVITKASVVDHIDTIAGPDDPRFFLADGQQALCERCHNRKRARESRLVPGWVEKCTAYGSGERHGVAQHLATNETLVSWG